MDYKLINRFIYDFFNSTYPTWPFFVDKFENFVQFWLSLLRIEPFEKIEGF